MRYGHGEELHGAGAVEFARRTGTPGDPEGEHHMTDIEDDLAAFLHAATPQPRVELNPATLRSGRTGVRAPWVVPVAVLATISLVVTTAVLIAALRPPATARFPAS